MRVFGLSDSVASMPTALLPDEMLLEGEGRVRALLCIGGNPMLSWPDQAKTEAGLKALDLLVTLDVQMSATGKHAHYVIAAPMALEVSGLTYLVESLKYLGVSRGYQMPWAQYTPPVAKPPPGSDLLEEHEFFFRVAQALDISLTWTSYHGLWKFLESPTERIPLDMTRIYRA